jgi:fluoride ion exporter CrcB/FEX
LFGLARTSSACAGVSLWRIIQGSTSYLPGRDDPFSQEYFWWAIIFGPLGCYARYYLSRYNGKLPGDWKWFPLGTFAANIAACVIDYVMKVVPVRQPLDSVSLAVLAGVVGGVGGCLSTVSTWVVEVSARVESWVMGLLGVKLRGGCQLLAGHPQCIRLAAGFGSRVGPAPAATHVTKSA